MLSVLHPSDSSVDWISVLLGLMLTIGTPITSQDSDLRPCSVTMWKLGDIVLCCLQCVLPPVFSLSSPPCIWEAWGRLRMKDGVSGGVCFILSCLAPHSRISFWTMGGGGGMRQLFKLYYNLPKM